MTKNKRTWIFQFYDRLESCNTSNIFKYAFDVWGNTLNWTRGLHILCFVDMAFQMIQAYNFQYVDPLRSHSECPAFHHEQCNFTFSIPLIWAHNSYSLGCYFILRSDFSMLVRSKICLYSLWPNILYNNIIKI